MTASKSSGSRGEVFDTHLAAVDFSAPEGRAATGGAGLFSSFLESRYRTITEL
jgi:hypothetical protein